MWLGVLSGTGMGGQPGGGGIGTAPARSLMVEGRRGTDSGAGVCVNGSEASTRLCRGKTVLVLWAQCLFPPGIHVLNPTPQCDGVRSGGLWEVISSGGWPPHEWNEDPYRRDPLPLPPREDTVRRRPSVNQEAGPRETPYLPVP